ncbi:MULTISPECIES: hypothetical protein [Sorangium]|nr:MULTISPECIES: hypothetical protein [Sorangium]
MAVVHCAGIPLSVQFDDGQPRIRDVDLAALLLLQRPTNIRVVIRGNLEFLEGHRVRTLSVQTPVPTGGVREDTMDEFWLSAQDALLVASQSRIKRGKEITHSADPLEQTTASTASRPRQSRRSSRPR